MTLSRISPEKGIHLLLEALALLEQEGFLAERDLCVFVCGEPAFMQGTAYQRVVLRAAAKLKKARVFFPGYLDSGEKQAYFKMAELFVSPSVHESYGLTVVEAMRAGLAVLASDHYGVRDLLEPGFGRRVRYPSPREAPAALARELKELLAKPEALPEMGRLARRAAAGMPFQRAADRVLETARGLAVAEAAEAVAR
jgi:glycosyltransferase involved in cell wall biosynthesis